MKSSTPSSEAGASPKKKPRSSVPPGWCDAYVLATRDGRELFPPDIPEFLRPPMTRKGAEGEDEA